MRKTILAAVAALCGMTAGAEAIPPIEAYGELPEISSLSISPSGARFAFIRRQGGRTLLAIVESGKGATAGVDLGGVKPRSVWFQGEDHVIIVASQATKRYGGYEDSQSFVYDIKTGETKRFLENERRMEFYRAYPNDFGNADPSGKRFYSSLYGGRATEDRVSMFGIADIEKQTFELIERGEASTVDWLVGRDGRLIAREDWDTATKNYRLSMKQGGAWKALIEQKNDQIPYSMLGGAPEGDGVIVATDIDGQDFRSYHKVDWSGKISPPLYGSDSREVGGLIIDDYKSVIGAYYDGLKPSYEFFDPQRTRIMATLAAQFPRDSVTIASRTDDLSKVVLRIEGGKTAPAYFLYDVAQKSFGKLMPAYLRIADEDIQPVDIVEYQARDGLAIPALVTRPKTLKPGEKPPLIVYPHGGPEAHDDLGFDYRAQYFASRGYVVLQPQFRGSSGFGSKLRDAGYRQWGRKMQDDITDGVKWLAAAGEIDPNRVCIMGASYGGYAALAGAVFTPDVYKCAVAVSGVADVEKMLDHEVQRNGKFSPTVIYWQKLIGDYQDKTFLRSISPAENAAAAKAPVLLIHGSDDTVVPISQSVAMEAALKAAGKPVRLVRLKGEDHYMSTSETRLQTLKEIDAFIAQHIGAK